MNYLLDTCTALWLWKGDGALSRAAERALGEVGNRLYFHQISYWEITIKHGLGKLRLSGNPSELVPRAVAAYGLDFVRLGNWDIAGLEGLPGHHGDPFDRILISHALRHDLTVLTPDHAFPAYGVKVHW